jgi:hypothetical protein
MAKIELVITVEDAKDNLKVDGRTLSNNNIPHAYRIAATIARGAISVKASKVGLKHVGGQEYLLTFE